VHHTVDDRLEVLQADRRSNDRFVGEFGDGRTDFVGVDGSRVPVFFDALGNVPTRRALVPVSRSRMSRRCSGETVSATGIEQTDSQYHVSARAAAASSASFDRPSEADKSDAAASISARRWAMSSSSRSGTSDARTASISVSVERYSSGSPSKQTRAATSRRRSRRLRAGQRGRR